MFHKEDVTRDTPIPVQVDGFPLVTTGRIVPNGNNVFVVATKPDGKTVEGSFGWDAVLQALNEKGIRLPLPNYTPKPATPGIDFLFPPKKKK